MCSSYSSVCVVLINRKKKQWNNLVFLDRYIRDLPPNRYDTDQTNAHPRTKEQSRSLPRIPLSVSDFILKIKY
jgi:hypothetical protein